MSGAPQTRTFFESVTRARSLHATCTTLARQLADNDVPLFYMVVPLFTKMSDS